MDAFARALRHGRFIIGRSRLRGAIIQGAIESEDLAVHGFEGIVGNIALAAARASAEQQEQHIRGTTKLWRHSKRPTFPVYDDKRVSSSRPILVFFDKDVSALTFGQLHRGADVPDAISGCAGRTRFEHGLNVPALGRRK